MTHQEYLSTITLTNSFNAAYRTGSPLVSDDIYDAYYAQLQTYEAQHPDMISPSSPTQRVGDTNLHTSGKIAHSQMYSMSKVHDKDAVRRFFDTCRSATEMEHPAIIMEDKLDGLAINLVYEGGRLQSASLRGEDGLEGDDVTAQALHMQYVCRTIPLLDHVEIRGEAIVTKSDFARVNASLPKGFADPRSMAVGAVRHSDPAVCSQRSVQFVAYYLLTDASVMSSKNQDVRLAYLQEWGFQIPHHAIAYGVQGIMHRLADTESRQRLADVPTDGVVLKLNDCRLWQTMGAVGKYPRWGCAYKFVTDTAITHLVNIEWNVKENGKVCPTAVFDTVHLYGKTNTRATMHSANWVEETYPGTYRVGDTLTTTFANMITPQILHVEHDGQGSVLAIPTHCPVCGSPLVRRGAYLYCTTPSAKAHKQSTAPVAAAPVPDASNVSSTPGGVTTRLSLKASSLRGMKVVVSGVFTGRFTRDQITAFISRCDGIHQKQVNSETDLVVAGANMGPAKRAKAENLGIRILTDEEFISLISR